MLLRWAQKTTSGYPGCNVTNLTTSFRDGLAYNAIIHRNRPDLLNYRACQKKTSRENLEQAFDVAERKLDVSRLLDPQDVDRPNPDEKAMITYLTQLYELFPNPPERNPLLDEEMRRRIDEWKDLARGLLNWTKDSTGKLEDRHFVGKPVAELKRLRDDTERFRSEEVPPKNHDRQRLANCADEIARMADDLCIKIENELCMDNINHQWDRMMNALKARAKALDDEIAKAEKLKLLLDKLLNDIAKANARMDVVEQDLNDVERQVSRIETPKDAKQFSPEKLQRISEELADIGIKIDSIKRLAEDFIKEAGRSHPDSIMVREKVADLDGRFQKLLKKLDNLQDQYHRVINRLKEMEDMRRAQARKEAMAKLRLKLDAMKRELDELERRIDNMGPVSKDFATLQKQLAELQQFDKDLNRARNNLNDLIRLAEGMIKDDLIDDPPALRAELQSLKDQLARIEDKAARLLREFEDALDRAERQKAAEEEIGLKLDEIKKELDELERRFDKMAPVAKDLPTLRLQLAELQDFERDLSRVGAKLESVGQLAEDMIRNDLISDPASLRANIRTLKDQYARLQDKVGRRMKAIQDGLRHGEAQRAAEQEINLKLDAIRKQLNDAEREIDNMSPVAKDLPTLKQQLDELVDFERRLGQIRNNLHDIARLADDMIRENLISDPTTLRSNISALKEQLARIEDKMNRRMRAINDGLKRAEAQKAAEAKYRLRLEDMKRELDEHERKLDNMAPVARDLGPLQEQLAEIEEFLQKFQVTKRKLGDLLKTGEDLIRDDLIADPQKLRTDMKELKDQCDRIDDKAMKRLRDIKDAMGRVAASDAIGEVAKWLERAKKVLVGEENVHGDIDTVTMLIEQHKSFQEELLARQPAINEVRRMEQELSSSSPQSGAAVREELAALSNQWREMEKLTREKSAKLEEALRVADQMHTSVHALLEWLADAEMKLRFAGVLPDDEPATRQELAEHEKMLRKMASQEQNMGQTLKLSQDILSKCHPDAEPVIKHWINIIQSRWDEIDAWAKQRGQRLADHLRSLQEILKLVEDLINWLARNEARLLSEESEALPENIGQLDALIDQHSAFMDELRKREPDVDRVVKIFASKSGSSTSKMILTTSTTKPRSSDSSSSTMARSGRLSGGARSTTPTRTSYATYRDEYPEVKQPRGKLMLEKWRAVWQLSLDKMQRLKDRSEHLKEVERLEDFDFDEWRRRFLTWVSSKKGRATDFFRSIDDDNDGRIPIESFINGVLRARFESSRLEMSKVADVIDTNHDGQIDSKEFLDSLRPDKPITNDELIQDEVQRQVSKCTCSQRYKVYHVGEGRYRFGESQKLRLVRILHSNVMVRVGGGWEALATFLQKNDPCRGKFFV